ncbi:hypothetical protein BV25DRAFT_1796113, partial [Artomyces pyxidatus]
YRCVECFRQVPKCDACMRQSHAHMPFHRVEAWSDSKESWERTTLAKLGLELHLGHGGRGCPIRIAADYRLMTIVHSRGMEAVKVGFCYCSFNGPHSEPEPQQLLRFGLFPGSWKLPMTAFTIAVLEDFKVLHEHSQVTVAAFSRYLKQSADQSEPDNVKNRAREFMTTYNEYCEIVSKGQGGIPCKFLAALRRSEQECKGDAQS